jgi:hypothetical protein
VRAPLGLSSIGSIPEPLAGIAMKGELYAFEDWDLGRIQAWPTLFSVGNVVTGKGNIVASRKHAKGVARHVTEQYLALAAEVRQRAPLGQAARDALLARIASAQKTAGYGGDYRAWIAAHTPPDRV